MATVDPMSYFVGIGFLVALVVFAVLISEFVSWVERKDND